MVLLPAPVEFDDQVSDLADVHAVISDAAEADMSISWFAVDFWLVDPRLTYVEKIYLVWKDFEQKAPIVVGDTVSFVVYLVVYEEGTFWVTRHV